MINIKNIKLRLLLNFFTIIAFISCNRSSQINLSEEEDMSQIIDSFEEYNNEDNHSSDYIYDQNKFHRFDIVITYYACNFLS